MEGATPPHFKLGPWWPLQFKLLKAFKVCTEGTKPSYARVCPVKKSARGACKAMIMADRVRLTQPEPGVIGLFSGTVLNVRKHIFERKHR